MPVDNGFTDPFSSSFLENVNSSFSLDKISSPPQLNASAERKRKYFEDENQDMSSILTSREFLRYTHPDFKQDENTNSHKMPTESKSSTSLDSASKTDDKQDPSYHGFYSFTSDTDQQIITSQKKQGTRLLGEDRAVPNDAGTRAVPSDMGTRAVPSDTGTRAVPSDTGTRAVQSEVRSREELASILNNLPSRCAIDEQDFRASASEQSSRKDASSRLLLPMKKLIQNLAEQIKDSIVQDWTHVFSQMECFEAENLERLDQILTAALAYESKLKNEKAALRNFVVKLSDVLHHD